MIHVFYRNRNTIGQLMIALMFVSGSVFMFTFDGFGSKSEATSCCCSGEAAVTSFAADSSGDYGSDIPMDAELTDGCGGGNDIGIFASTSGPASSSCNCLGADKDCGLCDSSRCNGGAYCPTDTSCSQDEGTCANYCDDEPWCSKGSRSSSCSAEGCPG